MENMVPRALEEKKSKPQQENQNQDGPSRHLWVGHLAQETPESLVREKFEKFGELDNVTVYPQRNYAFVNFRRQEDAEKAKDALHGSCIGDNVVRIEFARGPRPNRHLLVMGISPGVTRDVLKEELLKYGPIDELKFMRDKDTAHVDYVRTDDAIAAVGALNGKLLGGEHLQIDYRNLPNKRAAPNGGPGSGPRGSSHEPSEVLWIGFPPNTKFDDETLHREFSAYGQVARVKNFESRNYCFIEFRSVEEATVAKNALSGKQINGQRVHIEFSTSEFGPVEDGHDMHSNKMARLSPEQHQRHQPKLQRLSPEQHQHHKPKLQRPSPEQHQHYQHQPSPEQQFPKNYQQLSRSGSPLEGEGNAIIAKDGTVVCQVQAYNTAGKTNLPDHTVNCTWRTDLDTLAKHLYVLQYSIVFFSPVRTNDVPAYNDFMNHLRERRRAGVARFKDGATIFLVPSSPFSEQVLKLPQNDCLFGVLVSFFNPQQQQPDFLPPGYAQPPVSLPMMTPDRPRATTWPPLPPTLPPALVAFSNGSAYSSNEGAQFQQRVQPDPTQQQPRVQLDPNQLAQLSAMLQQQQQQPSQREVSPLSQQQQQQVWPPHQVQAQAALENLNPTVFGRTLELARQLLQRQQQQ